MRSCLYTDVSNGGVSGNAVRDVRWKLIELDNGQQRFFDLLNDPWEATDLLPGGLDAEGQLAFDVLSTGCSFATAVNDLPTASTFTLYPNPATNEVIIRAPQSTPVEVVVRDAVGTLVFAATVNARLDVSNLASGIYFTELRQGDLLRVIKLLKE